MSLKQTIKVVLPAGQRTRRLPVGIGRGLTLTIDLRDGQIGTYLGLYEMELNRHLRRLCPPGARSFDLGGHIGYDALVLAKLSGSDVLTVEADPAWCSRIHQNLRANPGLEDRVKVLANYVGGPAEESPPGAAQVTVDGLASSFFVPDFVKMDIEGGEVAALHGASQTLSERQPNLLIEVHSLALERECLDILRAHGYQPTIVDQRRFLRDHRPTAHNRWIVASREDAPRRKPSGRKPEVRKPPRPVRIGPSTRILAAVLHLAAPLRLLPLRGRGRVALTLHRCLGARANFALDVTMRKGSRLVVPMTSAQAWRVVLTGRYDDEVIALLSQHISPDSLVVDVGASLGLYSVALGAAAKAVGSEVLAVEPLERNCRITQANIDRNDLRDVVSIMQCALGSREGSAVLHSEPQGAGNGHVIDGLSAKELARHDNAGRHSHEERVAVRRLDDVVGPIGKRVSLLKIDVEGLEFDVLAGAGRTIRLDRPVIYAELAVGWLQSRGVSPAALRHWLLENTYCSFEVRPLHVNRWSDRRSIDLREILGSEDREDHDLLLLPKERCASHRSERPSCVRC